MIIIQEEYPPRFTPEEIKVFTGRGYTEQFNVFLKHIAGFSIFGKLEIDISLNVRIAENTTLMCAFSVYFFSKNPKEHAAYDASEIYRKLETVLGKSPFYTLNSSYATLIGFGTNRNQLNFYALQGIDGGEIITRVKRESSGLNQVFTAINKTLENVLLELKKADRSFRWSATTSPSKPTKKMKPKTLNLAR